LVLFLGAWFFGLATVGYGSDDPGKIASETMSLQEEVRVTKTYFVLYFRAGQFE